MTMTYQQANSIPGRCIMKDGVNFTAVSASTFGEIHVWNPETRKYVIFQSLALFENWAYGKPISSVGE